MDTAEIKSLSQQLIDSGLIDFLDLSLWDVFKPGRDGNKSLMNYFAGLDRKGVKLTVAGKIYGGEEVRKVLEAGIDFVTIGKSAILHHDFPAKVMADPDFRSVERPVSVEHLQREGLSSRFIDYVKNLKGFVKG